MTDETTKTTRARRERPARLSSQYQRVVIEWLVVVLFAGLVAGILAFVGAIVYWAWAS